MKNYLDKINTRLDIKEDTTYDFKNKSREIIQQLKKENKAEENRWNLSDPWNRMKHLNKHKTERTDSEDTENWPEQVFEEILAKTSPIIMSNSKLLTGSSINFQQNKYQENHGSEK